MAVTVDMVSRRAVGWSMSLTMMAQLAGETLTTAIRLPEGGFGQRGNCSMCLVSGELPDNMAVMAWLSRTCPGTLVRPI